ncbi:G-type lectin S-receptor-like serine/threonine-protein kinase [Salvia divinorum]|uniref:Receptor-like serine/threonine-protein kinase n=1 Tax=Salvia divinorum TaxID=28513 RepID=A0ABD1HZ31_SALDI
MDLSLIAVLSLHLSLASAALFTEFIRPDFTATNLKFVDSSGAFLVSPNGTFKAAMFNPGAQQLRFYFCVVHAASNAVTWSANRDAPVSKSGTMTLTESGLAVADEHGSVKWLTPPFRSPVAALQLTETGNLVALDQLNASLWESFSSPTDTLVMGQRLHIGTALSSSVLNDDLSTGAYRLVLTASDAVLQWRNLTYWKMSMDVSVYVNSFATIGFMEMNQSGVYLSDHDGSSVVVRLSLPETRFRLAKIDQSGQFSILSYSGATPKQDFVMPVEKCRVPVVCGTYRLCSRGASADSSDCTCPTGFRATPNNSTSCVPSDIAYSLPVSCGQSNRSESLNSSNSNYLQLGHGVDYFANEFVAPQNYGVDVSQCRNLCSQDCSCLGFFFENPSGSCYRLEDAVGSVMMRASSSRVGFIKVVVQSAPPGFGGSNEEGLPLVAVVLLPASGLLVLFVIGILLCRKYKQDEVEFVNNPKNYSKSMSFDDLEFSIPGLPQRFDYEEIERATENFKTKIGTGGFGTVYKGMLNDKSLVAVKMITNLGVRGKSDFCTEIGVIGSIHHLNLVKLRGYCAQRRQWLLVYEYMNRGSLDKTLFGSGPPLEWEERVEIALGAARGLAYLHSGCEHKIIHCDVKPENILLHDQNQAKLSDFGLAKLLSREDSSLFTTMRGTRGYLAPEWLTSSTVSDKTDVYSYGMVLLEIVSGRKNCLTRARSHSLDEDSSSQGTAPCEFVYFPLYALEMHEQGRYSELVDPRIVGRVTSQDVEKLVRVALCCVQEEPGLRPSMTSVVGMLEGKTPLGTVAIEALNFLRFYGRRFVESSVAPESGGGLSDVMVFPDANASHGSNQSMSTAAFSFISSQNISGPR